MSAIIELHNALGQYQVYLAVLEKVQQGRSLFLVVSKSTYDELSAMDTFILVVERFGILLVVIRIDAEEVDTWKK